MKQNLITCITQRNNIESVIRKHNKNSQPGLDNLDWDYITKNKEYVIDNVIKRIHNYETPNYMKKYLTDRTVFVPTIEERILQLSIVVILEEYFFNNLYKHLFKFVKGEKALSRFFTEYKLRIGNVVAYADIQKYSDNIEYFFIDPLVNDVFNSIRSCKTITFELEKLLYYCKKHSVLSKSELEQYNLQNLNLWIDIFEACLKDPKNKNFEWVNKKSSDIIFQIKQFVKIDS